LYPDFSVQAICDAFGKSRQAHYKLLKRDETLVMQHAIIIQLVRDIREDMSQVGGRKLYHMLGPQLVGHGIDIGRDKLFDVLADYGLLVKRRKRRNPITTESDHPFYKYPNLIKDLEIHAPNVVWVSDITYIRVATRFCYLSLITDAYSRKIVGYCLWQNLSKEGPMNALRMAIGDKDRRSLSGLIHHSDRGLQYCCGEYIQTLEINGIGISMTMHGDPYENAQAERVNGILKTEFKLDIGFKTHEAALEAVSRSIDTYNSLRPHASCNYLTPDEAHKLTGVMKKRWKQYYKPKLEAAVC
jgi:putative transposase